MPNHITPYQESLVESEEAARVRALFTPSYMRAADTLSEANRNTTFAEDVATLGNSISEGVQSIPKFIAVSLISGGNQIYSAPLEIGNLFGADNEITSTEDVVASMDSDLGKFYAANKEGADLVGFVAGSLIPGLAGMKVLNAGQTALKGALVSNKFGTGMGKALGLLVPDKEKWLRAAVLEVRNGTAVPTLLNKNALRGMAAGLGQNMLEATAFEVAVAATMFNSPVLEEQDLGDLVSNIMWGGLVFGAVGGTVDATKAFFTVSKAAKLADREAMPWTRIDTYSATTKLNERIVLNLDQIDAVPAVPAVFAKERFDYLTTAARKKVDLLEQDTRKAIGSLANEDQAVAQVLYDTAKLANSSLKRKGTLLAVEEVTRIAEVTKLSKKLDALDVALNLNKATLKQADEAMDYSAKYLQTWGERAGKFSEEAPVVSSLVDTLKKGEELSLKGNKVTAGANSYKTAPIATFDILKTSSKAMQARFFAAMKSPKLKAPTKTKPLVISESDVPYLEKAMQDLNSDTVKFLEIKLDSGTKLKITSREDLTAFVIKTKQLTAYKLLTNNLDVKLTVDEIALSVNVKPSVLAGEYKAGGAGTDNMFASQAYTREYSTRLREGGLLKKESPDIDLFTVPQHVKITYNSSGFKNLNNFVTENLVQVQKRQKVYQQGVDVAVTQVLDIDAEKLIEIRTKDIIDSANRLGSGGGLLTAASANYGALAAKVEQLGNVVTGIVERRQSSVREVMAPVLYKLGQNKQAAVEWSTLNAKLRSFEDLYVLNAAGDALEPAVIKAWKQKVTQIRAINELATTEARALGKVPTGIKAEPVRPVLKAADSPVRINIENKETLDLVKVHIETNAKRVEGLQSLRTAQGVSDTKNATAFYPIPVDPKEYPYFALVVDDSITGTGHVKTLYASTKDELKAMTVKLEDNPHLTVRFKADAEAYYDAIGQWDIEKTLNANYLDSTMQRKGISAPYFVPTDPAKIVNDVLNWSLKREAGLVRETVLAKYEVPFSQLRKLGDVYTKEATSKFSNMSLLRYADEVVENPYGNYIKTALGLKNYADYPWWVETNKLADKAVTAMYDKVSKAFKAAKTETELADVNKILNKAGYKGAAYDVEMDIFANAETSSGVLSLAVQKANSILATVALRLDFLNAVNNAISSSVLLGSEARAVIKAIEAGDSNAVGALAKLAKITVPGTNKQILSPAKLIANSIKKFGRKTPEMQFYRDNRFMTSISDQYSGILDSMTFNGKESVKAWSSKLDGVHRAIKKSVDVGEELTGNKLAEEFNRFVAADVMKQITDIAVKSKIMSAKEQLAYINTFVNRTQGNYLSSQRPMVFQGAIGQAIGLFQTYQFNLMQQLLRHVGEGGKRDAMTLLGLQGAIHGMNGLPAFNAINTSIVGNASGNQEHRDLYDATYGTVGKEAGNWLLYGVASNMLLHPDLKVNLYVRGDINPRYITVLPTSPADVAIISASTKFFGNLFETASKIQAGGDVGTVLLQGLEHNGLSRPLAGLAQTLEAVANPLGQSYSTSNRGNVIASNDLLSLANLGRMVGGKPMEEAIAIDATFRLQAYNSRDSKRRRALGEAIKSTMIAGQEPSSESIDDFAIKYTELGGKQEQFNQWMVQLYKTANTSQANKLQEGLAGNLSQNMQRIMGGAELQDFSEE